VRSGKTFESQQSTSSCGIHAATKSMRGLPKFRTICRFALPDTGKIVSPGYFCACCDGNNDTYTPKSDQLKISVTNVPRCNPNGIAVAHCHPWSYLNCAFLRDLQTMKIAIFGFGFIPSRIVQHSVAAMRVNNDRFLAYAYYAVNRSDDSAVNHTM